MYAASCRHDRICRTGICKCGTADHDTVFIPVSCAYGRNEKEKLTGVNGIVEVQACQSVIFRCIITKYVYYR